MFTSNNVIVGAGIAAISMAMGPTIEEFIEEALVSQDWDQRHLVTRVCSALLIPGTVLQSILLTPFVVGIGGTLCLLNGRCKPLHKNIFASLQECNARAAFTHLLVLHVLNPYAVCSWENPSLTSKLIGVANRFFDKLDKNPSWIVKKVIRRCAYMLFAASLVLSSVPSMVMGVAAGALSLLAGTLGIFTGKSYARLHGFAYQELRDTFKFNAIVFCAVKFKDPDSFLKLSYTTENGIAVQEEEANLPQDTSGDESPEPDNA